MKKKKADSFTCFLAALCTLIFFLLIRLFLGMQEERRTYTALVSLGDLTYDNDFLKSSKIIGIQAVYSGCGKSSNNLKNRRLHRNYRLLRN